MGYSLSWVAVKQGNAEAIHSVLGLKPTGNREEIPESDVVGTLLPNGWYLVLFHRKEIGEKVLKQVSDLGDTVHCFVEDHVMVSSSSGWQNGKEIWSVVHDCEKGRYHLEIRGVVPPVLEEIHKNLAARQDREGGEKADVDLIYDVPPELAKQLTGFRHDQDTPGLTGDAFEVLEHRTFLRSAWTKVRFRE